MTTRHLRCDSRCADCRTLLRENTTGYEVHDRLLCRGCASDATCMEVAL
jgi:hypothetical protein